MVASGGENTYYEKIRYFLKKNSDFKSKTNVDKDYIMCVWKESSTKFAQNVRSSKLNLKVVV